MESEAGIVIGMAQQHDSACARVPTMGEAGFHQRTAYAPVLPCWSDRHRCQPHKVQLVCFIQMNGSEQDMADYFTILFRHQ